MTPRHANPYALPIPTRRTPRPLRRVYALLRRKDWAFYGLIALMVVLAETCISLR